MKKVRCAIYTRKSSEEGLDQDFNSLDAQREACEAYIASQKHEGWVALPERFDDGGVSGGTLERNALQTLLKQVDAGLVDQIVVYKIDRLTRSLMDFSKLIERLDKAQASFVSVTQSFNTATSMGRLTLNVLLSFAQFEREVTAERIRDKIAASKKKGLWMGGPVPLGYITQNRQLVIHEKEADQVRLIYSLYLKHRTVRHLKAELDGLNLVSRPWTTRSGEPRGGQPYSRGHLYRILTNPIYIGKVSHRRQRFDGVHQGIINREVWDQVQEQLKGQAAKARSTPVTPSPSGELNALTGMNGPTSLPVFRSKPAPSSLLGKLYDETGDRLTPSHANKKGKHYRYYVSNRLIRHAGEKLDKGGWRLPAKSLEDTVTSLITNWLQDHRSVMTLLEGTEPDTNTIERVDAGMKTLATQITTSRDQSTSSASLLHRATVYPGHIEIQLNTEALLAKLRLKHLPKSNQVAAPIQISAPFQHRKRGVESKLVLGFKPTTHPDPILIRNVAQARQWLDQIKQGTTLAALARQEQRSIRQIQRHLELAFLSPTIIQKIAEGSHPTELTSRQLVRTAIPMEWKEQHQLFGI